MGNRKIKNARRMTFDGIEFKSELEVRLYKTLKEANINCQYEQKTFNLTPGIRPTKPFYVRSKSKGFHLDTTPIKAITYTPDFTFVFNDILVIIEAKGFANDVYPLKRKLFRLCLERSPLNVMFFEVKTKKDLMDAIKIVQKESKAISEIRTLIAHLPAKDVSICYKLLESRDFNRLQEIVDSDLKKMTKGMTEDAVVLDPTISKLTDLSLILSQYTDEDEEEFI